MITQATTTAPLLVCDGVSKAFGTFRAVEDVSLEVPPGRIIGVIGPNGAGKTTLLNLISGAVKISAGEVWLADRRISRKNMIARNRLGVVRTFQQPRLVPEMSVVENVALGAERQLQGQRSWRTGARALRMAAEALDDVGVDAEQTFHRVRDVPPTIHRWVEIARLFAARPRIALFDEPNSGFTVGETRRLVELLQECAARGAGVVLVTHDVTLAMRCCDEIVVMTQGTVLFKGAPGAVADSPEVRASYLGQRASALAARVLGEVSRGSKN